MFYIQYLELKYLMCSPAATVDSDILKILYLYVWNI